MNSEQVIDIFKSVGAVLEGHFILTSGLRSPVFLQKARVFMHADKTEVLCKALAQKITDAGYGGVDHVVGPAIGGLIPAYETSRHMDATAIWVEREGGEFRLKRFEVSPGSRVVIVEDIVTTGLSIRETIACMQELGIEVAAAACLIDRSGGKCEVGVPLIALASYQIPTFEPDKLPPELASIPPIKPGSRNI